MITNSEISVRIYKAIEKIPRGYVVTYGRIASLVQGAILKSERYKSKIRINPRYVGYLLHHNPDQDRIPCHRVVDRSGHLAQNYKFGGWKEQRRKLLKEGIGFKDERRVDIDKYLISSKDLRVLYRFL